jgi:hypothetical protein
VKGDAASAGLSILLQREACIQDEEAAHMLTKDIKEALAG